MASFSPFSNTVVHTMRRLFPEALADASFDNTGLLLQAPLRKDQHQKNSVLLTVDLTQAVTNEAIRERVSIIIAYHPIIFKPLKSLTLDDPQQNSLLRLAQEGISVGRISALDSWKYCLQGLLNQVYSPHTALDASPKGINTWLADIVTLGRVEEANRSAGDVIRTDSPTTDYDEHQRAPIQPVTDVEGVSDAGMGCIVHFTRPQKLRTILSRITSQLSTSSDHQIPVALPQRTSLESIEISSVGICAGSGGSLLRHLDVDMLLTGELSHHETLTANEHGRVVVTTFHSNTERGYLWARLKPILEQEILQDWAHTRATYEVINDGPNGLTQEDHILNDPRCIVAVSNQDRDPYQILRIDTI